MMRHYYHQASQLKRERFLRRVKILSLLVGVPLILGAIYLGVDSVIEYAKSSEPSETTPETHTILSPATNIIRTSYFQFQADTSWVEIANETSGNKFVYRSFDKHLIKRELVVFVDSTPQDLPASHVLPVIKTEVGTLQPRELSNHCKDTPGAPASVHNVFLTVAEVEMKCQGSGPQYRVVVGEIGGNESIALTRPDQTVARYTLYYSDVTVNPTSEPLVEIVKSFQTR